MAGSQGNAYTLSRPTGLCAATGNPIAPGETYVAVLVETEPDGTSELQRLDFSLAAWEAGTRPDKSFSILGFWRAVFHPGDQKKRPFLGDDELLDIFEQLASAPDTTASSSAPADPKQAAFRFVLCLLLLRRKLLVLDGGRPGIMIVRPKSRAGEDASLLPRFEVIDPTHAAAGSPRGLDPEILAGAMERIGELMPDEPAHTSAPTSAHTSAPTSAGASR